MGSPYTEVSISGYNSSPPDDDGSNVETNQLTWANHTSKIGNPLRDAINSINTNVKAAFEAIYDQTAAESAAGVTPTNFEYLPGNVLRYGTNTTPGTTDMLSAFNSLVSVAKQETAPKLVIPAGQYYVSAALVFDVPNDTTIEWSGDITTDLSNATAIQLGDTASQTQRLTVYGGIRVDRSTDDTTGSSVGIEIRRVQFAEIHVARCTSFRTGIKVSGVGGGCSHVNLYPQHVHDNHVNLKFTADSSGFCNEHKIYGGSYSYSSGYGGASTAVHLEIDFNSGAELNNISFYSPSFEAINASTKCATIHGNNILIAHPRIENSGDQDGFEIEFTSNSIECALIGKGFSIKQDNVTDNGANNIVYARDGVKHSYQVAAATDDKSATTDDACHEIKSSSSNAAVGYRVLDSSGNVMFVASTGGRGYFNDRCFFNNGIRWGTTAGGYNDRGLFRGSGSPEGVVSAQVGSLYSRTDGGAGTTLYVKESGSSNTGWVAK